jgi:hypothetical protein
VYGARVPASGVTVRALHRLARGQIRDAGQCNAKDGDIIECCPDGRESVEKEWVITL